MLLRSVSNTVNQGITEMTTTNCGKCNTPPEARKPCPHCGSTSRAFSVTLESKVEFHSSLSYKAKRGGKGKPFIEGIRGESLFRKLKRWMRLERVIDREHDHYKEVVTDPETGEEIHRCEEPLSQHTGHGDDKKNRSSNST
jgi:hypothetical protein